MQAQRNGVRWCRKFRRILKVLMLILEDDDYKQENHKVKTKFSIIPHHDIITRVHIWYHRVYVEVTEAL